MSFIIGRIKFTVERLHNGPPWGQKKVITVMR